MLNLQKRSIGHDHSSKESIYELCMFIQLVEVSSNYVVVRDFLAILSQITHGIFTL